MDKYIYIYEDKLKYLFYNDDPYYTIKHIAISFDVSTKVIDKRIKMLGLQRKIKNPRKST